MVQYYPGDDKNDLRARFRKRDDNHESAFFELFLYEVVRRLGLNPEVHPEPSTGRVRRMARAGVHDWTSMSAGSGEPL